MFKQRSRSFFVSLGLTILLTSLAWTPTHATTMVFINEIHYDNAGGDIGEAIEIAGPAGTNLSGWSILLYNGNGGGGYNTINLSGSIADQQNGFGTLAFLQAGIQNGAPDGLALIDATNTVIQFLSYEGSFMATNGVASGMTSTDIGVIEPGTTPVGNSLQLTGTGTMYEDFMWTAAMNHTFGSINTRQTFIGSSQQPVPEPSTFFLLVSGLSGLSFWRWKRKQQLN